MRSCELYALTTRPLHCSSPWSFRVPSFHLLCLLYKIRLLKVFLCVCEILYNRKFLVMEKVCELINLIFMIFFCLQIFTLTKNWPNCHITEFSHFTNFLVGASKLCSVDSVIWRILFCVSQVAFLFALGGCEDCHNPCNLKWGLWNKARGLGQGWTRPAGRAPGWPSPRAAGPRAGSTWSSAQEEIHHFVLHYPNRRTVIRLTHHIMANRDIIEYLWL